VLALCRRIVDVATSSSSSNIGPLLLWLTPLLFSTTLTQEQKNQFLQIVATGENSAKTASFQLFDQLHISLADWGSFTNNQRGHFSSIGMYEYLLIFLFLALHLIHILIGIRLLSILLSETAAENCQRSALLPVSSSSSSPVRLVVDTATDSSRILNDNRTQSQLFESFSFITHTVVCSLFAFVAIFLLNCFSSSFFGI
jgi:hypothetical protein